MKELELKEMGGIVFKNDRKTEDKHPDFKGQILIDGERFDIALWELRSGKGFSIRLDKPRNAFEDPSQNTNGRITPDEQVQQPKQPKQPQTSKDQDDLPF